MGEQCERMAKTDKFYSRALVQMHKTMESLVLKLVALHSQYTLNCNATITDSSLMIKRGQGSVLTHRFQIFKMVGAKFHGIFLIARWLKRNLSFVSMTLPLNFSEILNIFLNYSARNIPPNLMK